MLPRFKCARYCLLLWTAVLFSQVSHADTSNSDPVFELADGFALDLVARDPIVQQPVYLSFDARGRMWVVQYLQFPFPAGLTVDGHDQYWRVQYKEFPPPPPPHGTPGRDKITILEDRDGDGTFEHSKDFVTGLNICTAALPGDGGVWVLNPPYLLFYPDANGDDVPDGDPEVHLEGFGLEDMHAVANSLRWGPDGMLYACQGSTTTATVKRYGVDEAGIHFTGQCIWRYNPKDRDFELFAEGGYNNFGIAVDNQGRMFTGTNGGLIGLHYVQGGNYWKSWGKHGPLTNPYSFGFFNAMEDESSRAKLSQAMISYDDVVLPERTWGDLLVARIMQRRIDRCELRPMGSTFSAHEVEAIVSTEDEHFRPVDMKLGPDGAVYIADWYDTNVTWNVSAEGDRTDRETGRIYRLRAADAPKEGRLPDLTVLDSEELVALLEDSNRWKRETARLLLAWRGETWPIPGFMRTLSEQSGQTALESLWTAYQCGGFTPPFARAQLRHKDPYVRQWTIRLLGEQDAVDAETAAVLIDVGTKERHPEVRSQLLSTARRLDVEQGLAIVDAMLQAAPPEDATDRHLPLLHWWAIDDFMRNDPDRVLQWARTQLAESEASIFRETLLPRLARRLAAEMDFDRLVPYLSEIRGDADFAAALQGMSDGLPAAAAESITLDFASWLDAWLAERPEDGALLALAIRLNRPSAATRAMARIQDDTVGGAERGALVAALNQSDSPLDKETLLALALGDGPFALREAALAALQSFGDVAIADALLAAFPSMPSGLASRTLTMLTARAAWGEKLLDQVEAGAIDSKRISPDLVANLRRLDGPAIGERATAIWGQIRKTPQETLARISAVRSTVINAEGHPEAGRAVYAETCAKCHVFNGEGSQVGPELTGLERDNLSYLLTAIVDPGSTVLPEYMGTILTVEAEDEFGVGEQILTGFILEESTDTVVMIDSSGTEMKIPAGQVKARRPMEVSIMPEGLLSGMSDAQVRDLFAYLQQELP